MNWNVIFIGLAFMILFSSFQIASMYQITTGNEIRANSIIYTVFCLSNFIVPLIIKIIGLKIAMVLSGLSYLLYIVMVFYPFPMLEYISTIIIGFGAALIWLAQGHFIYLQSSNEEEMSRNTGIFWSLYQSHVIISNLQFVLFSKNESENGADRTANFTVLLITGIDCSLE